ncbi:HepT-like ribonuclease domain-containing protein [Mongoliibacter ruber]|uniref:Uncharacterized protein with HEPN domain n=1 Tax=Mongoliibacter ruber TaxID=1750599 RepID=A0A2T0WR36_9BACT|nr:HepT-like ribonuclease domain-containing protein [Mongoliibacter ruber]PRY89161.1 uncharacterized protein with HEPN domain [Mongoliibacter ruber]
MKKDEHIESMVRLTHIKDAIKQIHEFMGDSDWKAFESHRMLQDAVHFQFAVIGEAIKYVEEEKLNKYDYPWHQVRSFRNLIVHEYFNIRIIAVWNIIKNDLDELEKIINLMLKNEFGIS